MIFIIYLDIAPQLLVTDTYLHPVILVIVHYFDFILYLDEDLQYILKSVSRDLVEKIQGSDTSTTSLYRTVVVGNNR